LVSVLALLGQEDVAERCLDVLEVEDYAVALLKHLMNQVSLQRDLVLSEVKAIGTISVKVIEEQGL
jgi:hypothetical protein